jgi:homoserine kinase type II
VPIENRRGGTWIEAAGHLWELTPWLAGAPAARLPLDVEKVQAAMAALAELHLPLAAFSASAATAPAAGPPPGLRRRLDLFAARQAPAQRAAGSERLPDGCGWETALVSLEEAVRRMGGPLRGSVARDLMAATQVRVPLQVCLRDIWRPHVLFERSAVTGVVDFGALDVDCVAGDIARLLGSLAGESAHGWQTGLAAYEAVRPLGDQERGLVPVYDRSGVLLSALHWIEWLRVERRPFPDKSAVRERLVELTERLLSLA